MISDELGRLADWVVGHAAKGHAITPTSAAALARCLLDLSQQAKQLERLPVDAEALHDDD